jgi:hypothetical protein
VLLFVEYLTQKEFLVDFTVYLELIRSMSLGSVVIVCSTLWSVDDVATQQ